MKKLQCRNSVEIFHFSSPYIVKQVEVPGLHSDLSKSEQQSAIVNKNVSENTPSVGITRIVTESEYSSCVPLSPLLDYSERTSGESEHLPQVPTIDFVDPYSADNKLDRQDSDQEEILFDSSSAPTSPPSSMTVTQMPSCSAMETGASSPSVLLAKHWGPERSVEILREPNCSLGISIVGGKVDIN